MFRTGAFAAVALALAPCVFGAIVPPALNISDNAGNSITIDSSGNPPTCVGSCVTPVLGDPANPSPNPLIDPTKGVIAWTGMVGSNLIVLNGASKPSLTNRLDVNVDNLLTSGPGSVSIAFTDTNFAVTGPETVSGSPLPGYSQTYSAYIDPTNTPFGVSASTLIGSTNTTVTNLNVPVTGTTSSMTLVIQYSFSTALTVQGSDDVYVNATAQTGTNVPPPPPPGSNVGSGDTATIGFWKNKNGTALISSLPGPPGIAQWLASNFGNLYGGGSCHDQTNGTDATVESLFASLFNVSGQKTYAQIMAGAIATYVTDTTHTASTLVTKFGFNSSAGGTGIKTYNVGNLGSAIGFANNSSQTVLALLTRANSYTSSCKISNAAAFNAFNVIFSGINQTGDIK